MELLLIRHGLPVRVQDADGPADPVLSDDGWWQADALAAWLAHEHLDAIWTSPMQRARQTAQPLERATGLQAVVDDDLAEFDAASRDYIPIEELKAEGDPRWQEMVDGTWVPEGGTTREEFRSACVPAVERVIEANPSRRVAVVCHGGVINAYLAEVLGIDDDLFFEPAYTSISRVMASSRGHRTLLSLNETAHLRPHLH